MKRLPEYEKIADGTSLEWPVCNSLWKCDGVEKRLKTMKLTHEGSCCTLQSGICIQPGSSHSETIEVCFKRNRVSQVTWHNSKTVFVLHMLLSNTVDWTQTGLYNRTLASKILKGILASR